MQLGQEVWGTQWSGRPAENTQVVLCAEFPGKGRHSQENPAPVCALPQGLHEQQGKEKWKQVAYGGVHSIMHNNNVCHMIN